jgi:hypothetical protein
MTGLKLAMKKQKLKFGDVMRLSEGFIGHNNSGFYF